MKNNKGSIILVVAGAITLLTLIVGAFIPPPGGKDSSWLAPKTWRSHKVADAVDTTQAKVITSDKQIVHSAHIEAAKLGETLVRIPDSPGKLLAQRFSTNSLTLLGQVDTVTVDESVALRALVFDMLSSDKLHADEAQAKQIAAEHSAGVLSEQNKDLKQQLVQAQGALRVDFEEKNNAFNELQTERAHKILLITVVIILLAGIIYLRIAFGGVGATLHHLESNPQYGALVTELDSNLGGLGQWFVRSSKNATAFTETKLEQARKAFGRPVNPA